MVNTRPVIIIGGGVAGLVAAVHLVERGIPPLLLEADPVWLGGRLRDTSAVTLEHGGRTWRFPGEHGVHGIWAPYCNFKALLTRYGILPELVAAREESWILGQGRTVRRAAIGSAIRGSWIPAPFHYIGLLARPSFLRIMTVRDYASLARVMGSLLGALSVDPLNEQKSLRGMSLADFMDGWSPNLRSLFAGLARNALAAHPEEVPAAGFIAFLRFYTLMRRDGWAFAYLPGTGGACVIEPLAAIARQHGAEIRLGARVNHLERLGDGWRVTYTSPAGDQASEEGAQLVLALDAPAAQRLLLDSDSTAEAARELRFPTGVPTAIVRLWFARRPAPVAEAGIFSGDFILDNFFWLDRLQPAYTDWALATGGSAVEMHVYGPPEALDQPDAILLARAITESYRAFPELRGQLLHQVLQRNEATHTLFGVGEAGEHLGIHNPWPDLFACGDWIAHPTPALYLERAATTGIEAANAILCARGLSSWPLEPYPQPEWLARSLASAAWRVRQHLLRRATASSRVSGQ